MGKSAGNSVMVTREMAGMPRRRFSICAESCAVAASSEEGARRMMCAWLRCGTPAMPAPGASAVGCERGGLDEAGFDDVALQWGVAVAECYEEVGVHQRLV